MMDNIFQKSKSNSISYLLKLIRILHKAVYPYVDVSQSRVQGRIKGSYKNWLTKQKLPIKGKKPETVLTSFASLFQGALRWHHPGTMINVTPPPTLPGVAASSYAMLFNPNFAQDLSSGALVLTELAVVKYLSELAGWDWEKSGGIFTFGGKGTNIYGIKLGVQKCSKDFKTKGIPQGQIFTITSLQGHPAHTEACDWLGIGKNNSIKVPTKPTGEMDVREAEKIIEKLLKDGRKLACITVNAGTTVQWTIDPIKEVFQMRNRLLKKYKLDYIPHIHADSVLGWVYLFFKDYDFNKNKLKIPNYALEKIQLMSGHISEIKYADSFGIDFHKTGYCPYISSCIMVKNYKEIFELNDAEPKDLNQLEFGNYGPFAYTLELSRSAIGPISAYITMCVLGKEGFQKLIADMLIAAEKSRKFFDSVEGFETFNSDEYAYTSGYVTLFVPKPPELYNRKLKDVIEKDEITSKLLADYIYQFYLFLLEKQTKRECSFTLDYSSGYDKPTPGFRIGVLKMYPMSPEHKEEVGRILHKIVKFKKEFDQIRHKYKFNPQNTPHKERPSIFKTKALIHPIF